MFCTTLLEKLLGLKKKEKDPSRKILCLSLFCNWNCLFSPLAQKKHVFNAPTPKA